MIVDLKPYAEYKAAGARLLGAVPAHWRVAKMRGLVRLRNERNRIDLPLLSVARERGVFVRHGSGEENHNVIPDDLSNYKVARGGDLVVNKMKAWQGSMGIAPCDGIVSPAYFVFRLAVDDVRYGQALLRSRPYVGLFAAASDGVRVGQWDLSIAGLREIPVLLPPQDEQAAIVRFLDYANGRLDRAIRAKRKVIALLQEQKQVIIHRAVTRGLDPAVPLKPSGVPWLCDIPQHWEVRRVKQATRIIRGKFSHRPRNDPAFYGGPYPFIQTGAVARAQKFVVRYEQTLNERGLAVSKLFPVGTLMMTIAANIGDVAVLTFDACFPDSIVGFVPADHINRDFLYLVFLCMKSELLREAPVNTQGNLSVERIGDMMVPVPPLAEQESIAAHVDRENAGFAGTESMLHREIELLREYRTRLTADVVTGKLDVREAARNLPKEPHDADEPPADEPEDLVDEEVGPE
jgi:type I restriction enzyme S subunit